MAMAVGGDDEFNSEINVTPMVDIMLVLLIIFMIVTPLLQQGVSVNLPRDLNAPVEDPDIAKDSSVIVAIPDDNNFYVGKDQFPIDTLGEKINTLMKDKLPEKRIVYIKSGIDVSYGTVVNAINEIRKQDIDRVGLVADKKKKDSGSEQPQPQ